MFGLIKKNKKIVRRVEKCSDEIFCLNIDRLGSGSRSMDTDGHIQRMPVHMTDRNIGIDRTIDQSSLYHCKNHYQCTAEESKQHTVDMSQHQAEGHPVLESKIQLYSKGLSAS